MILYFDTLESTNSTLKELAKNDAKPFLTVYTKNQTKGKGTFGNQWLSEPNKNLLFSVLIENPLPPEKQYYISFWTANCLYSTINKLVENLSVKWPNDLVIRNKKVCGILIENQKINDKNYAVIGIGLNVNQTEFESLPKATSLKLETGKTFDLEKILSDSLSGFKLQYQKLDSKIEEILIFYNQHLFRKNIVSAFKDNDIVFNGIIRSVNQNGELIVELDDETTKPFRFKEVELLY